MANGVGGILIDNLEECADTVRDLLLDHSRRNELANAGKERVRQHFLLPRLLLDELRLMSRLTSFST
jgi:trehalose synthase